MSRSGGFVNHELQNAMFVVFVIGVLGAIAIPNLLYYRAMSHATVELGSIESAEKKYRADHGTWAPSIEALGVPRVDESYEIRAVAEAGSNGALVLQATGGRLKKPVERRVTP